MVTIEPSEVQCEAGSKYIVCKSDPTKEQHRIITGPRFATAMSLLASE